MDTIGPQFPISVALAAIAVIGYLLGRRTLAKSKRRYSEAAERDIRRAAEFAQELESVAEQLRQALAVHHSNIARFKARVAELSVPGQDAGRDENRDAAWDQLSAEADQILKPTLRLASQLASGYDEIRQQTQQLLSFRETRAAGAGLAAAEPGSPAG